VPSHCGSKPPRRAIRKHRHLGAAYEEGRGTEQNLPQAYAWCSCSLATAESSNDAAAASARAWIATSARQCLFTLQGKLNEEQMQHANQLAAQCRHDQAGPDVGADQADVDVRDADGRTPLMSASARGDGDVVARLLKEGADPNLRDKAFGKTALMYAAQNDRAPVAQQLLLAGASPDIKDDQGWTALCYSALSIRPGIVIVLLEAHPSVNVQTNDGRTPLIIAAREGNAKTVQLLLDARADPNLQDRDGRTALSWASSKGFVAVQALLQTPPGKKESSR
jgi:ankyrin repeat protein